MYIDLLADGLRIMPETDFEMAYLNKLYKNNLIVTKTLTLDTKTLYSLDIKQPVLEA
jgi:hypothetical protein